MLIAELEGLDNEIPSSRASLNVVAQLCCEGRAFKRMELGHISFGAVATRLYN